MRYAVSLDKKGTTVLGPCLMPLLKIETSPKPHVVFVTHDDDSKVLEAEETIEKKRLGRQCLRPAARLSQVKSCQPSHLKLRA